MTRELPKKTIVPVYGVRSEQIRIDVTTSVCPICGHIRQYLVKNGSPHYLNITTADKLNFLTVLHDSDIITNITRYSITLDQTVNFENDSLINHSVHLLNERRSVIRESLIIKNSSNELTLKNAIAPILKSRARTDRYFLSNDRFPLIRIMSNAEVTDELVSQKLIDTKEMLCLNCGSTYIL